LATDLGLRKSLLALHERRCGACHQAEAVTRLDWIDVLTPSRSLFLCSPLAQEAGGRAKCGPGVYQDRSDPDYLAARRLVEEAVQRAWEKPRRDLVLAKTRLRPLE